MPKRSQRDPKWSQGAPKGCQKGAKGSQMGAQRRPKFAPGPGAARPRSVLTFGVPACFLPACTLSPHPRSRSGFCDMLFFSRRIPSWIPPFPSLVGRVLVTFWPHCAHFWLKVGCSFFVMCFWECFLTIFDVFLISFWG